MHYYQGNALYQYIENQQIRHFRFVSGNMWQLVYGDQSCTPKLLTLVIGSSQKQYHSPLLKSEIIAFRLLKKMSELSNIPLKIIKFNADTSTIESVIVLNDTQERGQLIAIQQLAKLFSSFGLPITSSSTAKYLNDKTSSAYHKWQRNSLGKNLTVSDIDLWKLSDQSIDCLFELKRSYIPLDRWKPFRDDYRNFRLLSKLANLAGVDFKIAYNIRYKRPFKDDISKIKVFKVNFDRKPNILEEGIFNTHSFFIR